MATTFYLAIDPGEGNGWAEFDKEGKPLGFGIARGEDELMEYLDKFKDAPPRIVIYDNFKLFHSKAKAQIGSEFPTVQAIGILKVYASKWKAKVVKQASDKRALGEMWSGMPLPKDHKNSHGVSAVHHGYYYLVSNNIIRIKI